MNLSQLKSRFLNHENINFLSSAQGLVKLIVCSHHSTGVIHLQGAHVTSFVPKNRKEFLWLSPLAKYKKGKPIRGGIPICWPWFGAHPSDPSLPQHGFARTSIFEIDKITDLNDGSVTVQLSLQVRGDYLKFGVLSFYLKVQINVGVSLTVTMTSVIDNGYSIPWSEAIHSYLAVDDIQNTSLFGLRDTRYYNQLSGQVECQLDDSVYFDQEIDRIYKQPSNLLTVIYKNKNLLKIQQSGSDATVIWNPWVNKAKLIQDFPDQGYQNMLCVEAANLETRDQRSGKQEHSISQMIS